MIETVIFDLDGVIIDSEPIHFSIEKNLFRELGVGITDEDHYNFVGTSSINMWQKIKTIAPIEYSVDELINITEELYLKHIDEDNNMEPICGVKKLIIELYNNELQLIIASSSSRKIIDTVLNRFNLTSYFSFLVSGADLAHSKPDPEIFHVASKLSRTDPEKCLVIEDSENGVRAAKAAEMNCVAFRNPNSGNQDLSLADIVISDFESFNIDRIISKF